MLITYRNHPVLKKLNEGTLGTIRCLESDVGSLNLHLETFRHGWSAGCPFFKKKIQVASLPFVDAMLKASPKMLDSELIRNVESQSGTILMAKTAFCYNVVNNGETDFGVNLFVFQEDSLQALVTFRSQTGEAGWASSTYQQQFGSAWYTTLCQTLFTYLNFLKYAPIEIKNVSNNSKTKDFNGKYCNQTGLNIEIVDSTWFTTLVKSEGFKVRGHFRFQPYGPKLSERRLIWINEFEKEGYVRNFKRPINIDDI